MGLGLTVHYANDSRGLYTDERVEDKGMQQVIIKPTENCVTNVLGECGQIMSNTTGETHGDQSTATSEAKNISIKPISAPPILSSLSHDANHKNCILLFNGTLVIQVKKSTLSSAPDSGQLDCK